jgi:hypothetical protein
MLELPDEEFRRLKDADLARVAFVPFDDPTYRDFLLFYHLLYVLAFQAANEPHGATMRWIRRNRFQGHRQRVLRLVHASWPRRVCEEAPWHVHYETYRGRAFAQQYWKTGRDRLLRLRNMLTARAAPDREQ